MNTVTSVPHCQDALHWLRQRGWRLSSLTDQDYAALVAIAHCWQLWTCADNVGRQAAIDAAAALLDGCQEVVWPMARELIAHAADWNHRDLIWLKVARRFEERVNEQRMIGSTLKQRDIDRIRRIARCHVGVAQVQP